MSEIVASYRRGSEPHALHVVALEPRDAFSYAELFLATKQKAWVGRFVDDLGLAPKRLIERLLNPADGEQRDNMGRLIMKASQRGKALAVCKGQPGPRQTVGLILAHRAENVIDIGDIDVLPALQGRGLGGLLMKHALNDAGRMKVTLTTQNENTAAVRWYERQGFTQQGTGRAIARYGRTALTELYMAAPDATKVRQSAEAIIAKKSLVIA